jgi:hypothetical protein
MGIAIGAVHVIAIPYVMEMVKNLFFILIKNWKILQGIISIPLIITAVLYWYVDIRREKNYY